MIMVSIFKPLVGYFAVWHYMQVCNDDDKIRGTKTRHMVLVCETRGLFDGVSYNVHIFIIFTIMNLREQRAILILFLVKFVGALFYLVCPKMPPKLEATNPPKSVCSYYIKKTTTF